MSKSEHSIALLHRESLPCYQSTFERFERNNLIPLGWAYGAYVAKGHDAISQETNFNEFVDILI
ncbi:hypothetical protein D3C75_582740 [compost metagenome]